MLAIVLKLQFLDHVVEVLIKGSVCLVREQGRDHPEHRPEGSKPVNVLADVGPAEDVQSPEGPIPFLASSVILVALKHSVLRVLEVEWVIDLINLGSFLLRVLSRGSCTELGRRLSYNESLLRRFCRFLDYMFCGYHVL